MYIRRVRNEAESMRRFVEELWLPYQHDLEKSVESHEMAEEIDVDEIVEFRTDWFDDPTKRLWVALDGVDNPTGAITDIDATFAGFLGTSLQTPASKFETADKLILGNFYVDPDYRGTALADDLVARGVQQAYEDGAEELTLQVHADNDRALAYYEKLGFDVARYKMELPLEEIQLDV
ncbi:GNAT family N-acetyltransferase [Halovenus rubra]|uniref:GNAT family N-acetyltransferase n=2 Tax=Halovenus rubra TaxID=869890 RepID=A0ACC7E0P7_9EURY|nr:GNAT family N-acetyltransferase [Halovenus rubra]